MRFGIASGVTTRDQGEPKPNPKPHGDPEACAAISRVERSETGRTILVAIPRRRESPVWSPSIGRSVPQPPVRKGPGVSVDLLTGISTWVGAVLGGRKVDQVVRSLLIGLAIAVGVWLVAILVLIASGQKSKARELATLIPNLLILFKGLLGDPRVPRSSKLWLGFAAVWIASPIDLIPEFIPIAGPLDDAIVAALVLRHVLKRTDDAVVLGHWRGDPATLETIIRLTRHGERIRYVSDPPLPGSR